MKKRRIACLILVFCLTVNTMVFAAVDDSSQEGFVPANEDISQALTEQMNAQDRSLETPLAIIQDTELPTISDIKVEGYTVTVVANDETGLHAEAYSFNGGWTWQSSNVYTSPEAKTWVVGTICVRDAAGNINYNRSEVNVPKRSQDSTPPEVISITVSNAERYTQSKTITVVAEDDGGEVKEYSFNGGWTWQTSPIFNISQPKEWIVGTIQVRDAEGNVNYNKSIVRADRFIQTTNGVNGKTVTVLANDNGSGYPPVEFSFNGGTTWQSSNVCTILNNTTWVPGTILARDGLGNVNYNGELVEVKTTNLVIDVSAYQGYIDWSKVKASGIDYAIIRAVTWSGGTSGFWVLDPFFEQNVVNAKNAGVKVGAYIYTYAFNDAEVAAEVNVFLGSANKLKSMGYTFDLPVFVDYEYNKILTNVTDYNERTRLLKLEMDMLFQNGYYSGMYMSTSWAQDNVNAAELQAQGYDLWIADYRGYNGWGDSVVMWQYTSTAQIAGVSGNVDMNYLYKDYSSVISGSDNAGGGTGMTTLTVYDQATQKDVTASRLEILAAIVNNEVGATPLTGQDARKLYQAQAVAAHSWILYSYENYNTLPSVKLKYDGNYESVKAAITEVENAVLTYNGKAANTVYGSSANGATGYTNSAKDYWGTDIPYLVSVKSPYENNYGYAYQGTDKTTLKKTEGQIKNDLTELVGGDYSSSYATDQWIRITSRNALTGYVTGIQVWGRDVSVAEFYEQVEGPYSPAFTMDYSNRVFTFKAYGNGHCVGMSQYGAMGLIQVTTGITWNEVLNTYYPGTLLTRV